MLGLVGPMVEEMQQMKRLRTSGWTAVLVKLIRVVEGGMKPNLDVNPRDGLAAQPDGHNRELKV